MTSEEWLTEPEFNDFVAGILGAEYVAIDTETNGRDCRDGSGYAMGISVAYDEQYAYFPFRHEQGYNYPREFLGRLEYAITNTSCAIFHNAKFDLVSLETLGIKFCGDFRDTLLLAHSTNENWPSKELDWLCKTLIKEQKLKSELFVKWQKAHGWEGIPSELMREYAEHDAVITLKLFHKLMSMEESDNYDSNHKRDFVRLITVMESRGIRINQDLCRTQAEVGAIRMETIALSLDFNPGSPKQLGEYLLDNLRLVEYEGKTPKGGRTFDKAAMEYYDELLEQLESPVAKQIVEYRGWSRACSISYNGYVQLVSPDGRLRPNYKLHGTVTGRMSCTKPNLQQIPRVSEKEWDGQLKRCFIPADGYELWEADYAQLEFRLSAAYAKENDLLEEFSKPDSDVFTRMASSLGFSRHDTKTLTYTLQYGGGINRISHVFGVDAARAEEIRDTYFQSYPGFKRMAQRASAMGAKRGWVKTWSGRKRHFQYPAEESHKAFNAIIQGGSADIMERSMLRAYNEVDSPDCRMLLQVHDSIVWEIKSEKVAEYLPKIKESMEAVTPDFGVKFYCDVHRWGE